MNDYYRHMYRLERATRWRVENELRTADKWIYVLQLIVCILVMALIVK